MLYRRLRDLNVPSSTSGTPQRGFLIMFKVALSTFPVTGKFMKCWKFRTAVLKSWFPDRVGEM